MLQRGHVAEEPDVGAPTSPDSPMRRLPRLLPYLARRLGLQDCPDLDPTPCSGRAEQTSQRRREQSPRGQAGDWKTDQVA